LQAEVEPELDPEPLMAFTTKIDEKNIKNTNKITHSQLWFDIYGLNLCNCSNFQMIILEVNFFSICKKHIKILYYSLKIFYGLMEVKISIANRNGGAIFR
jgi:hypothetical protein